ncbi:hypothetical protein [Octadecabacter ascidiaceicola]|uniref:hypothetical protein n=1 Tax=Octadecabacter ascidiaceicola TaxID=1655543 RepID=UPI00117DF1EE|nr:hypothetical protein [Octadecabacter ascidiaceicola]
MSNTVSATERGLIRLYSIEMPAEETPAFIDQPLEDDAVWPVMDALGARYLDSDFIEVFDVASLEEIGFKGYLILGNGVAEEDVAPYAELLDQVTGTVLMVVSSAFGGFEQELSPKRPLRHIATFKEASAPVQFEQLPRESAKGVVGDTPMKKKPSDAAMSGRIATLALLVMFLLVALMIWVAR